MVKEENVFGNDLRKMIFNHILNYPGVSFGTLFNIFELTDGGLRYHLDYLARCDKITVRMENGSRSYYPLMKLEEFNKELYSDSNNRRLNPVQLKLIETIKLYPGITQKDLIFRTRLSRYQVSRNMRTLVDNNFVKELKVDKNICYQLIPDDELRSKIIQKLILKLSNSEIDEVTFLKIMKSLE